MNLLRNNMDYVTVLSYWYLYILVDEEPSYFKSGSLYTLVLFVTFLFQS